jgi:hypothetical protein
MQSSKPLLGACIVAGSLIASAAAQAAFQVPDFRGTPGSLYAEWDQFNSTTLDTEPDVGQYPSPPAAGATSSVAITGALVLAGGSNPYSFAGPISVTVTQSGTGDTRPTEAWLQLRTVGSEVDFDSVLLAGVAPTSTTTLLHEVGTFFNPTTMQNESSYIVETLFRWRLPAGIDSYAFSFSALGPHMSFDRVAVDIAPAAVPLPAAAWLLGSALAGLAGISRRLS